MKIAIAGSGALGSRFGFALHQADNEVVLIDNWVDHINAIREHGLKMTIDNQTHNAAIPIITPQEIPANVTVELLIVFTKAMQLDQMLQDVKPIMNDNTKVLCLLNGIGHEDIIAKHVSRKNIFIGNTMWTANLVAPGHSESFGAGSVNLQNLAPGEENMAIAIADVLTEAGLNAHFTENVHNTIYLKACVNGTMNGLCTLLDVNMADFGATKDAHDMVASIVKEFAAVAAFENVQLDVEEAIEFVEKCYDRTTIGEHFPSMHQDLIKNHRLTEIDYINGAISRKGRKYGVSTPYCDFLTQLIHAKEDIILK
ncbi:2-dehydropantoate 2-reductase [Paucilactobacillus nenjiangensis]|uniref:2-dehydropantoate 2-reductase n=1 Tax=Paucilactobacillus nenjiangensis TaxID=1296540 RepID=A0A5P1WYZ6_9LACO|nr:2-dehydropantoate 2-reductase [Paucilactobacillus nenjiangensis]QER66443.1 2-dehydropantoate 2-reductase [Paucilactobacillus nenjiangensis]